MVGQPFVFVIFEYVVLEYIGESGGNPISDTRHYVPMSYVIERIFERIFSAKP